MLDRLKQAIGHSGVSFDTFRKVSMGLCDGDLTHDQFREQFADALAKTDDAALTKVAEAIHFSDVE